jgi:hypothetical protein
MLGTTKALGLGFSYDQVLSMDNFFQIPKVLNCFGTIIFVFHV